MKFLLTLFATRLRSAAFSLVARGLMRLVMAMLAARARPGRAAAGKTNGQRPVDAGQVIDGEFRRLQNDRS
ncbi:MAG TPA: hypothetical protein VFY24_02845 [Azospira sp.]|nr:hypothetical protein [Azospira sp.]